jgi:hypothetical protein
VGKLVHAGITSLDGCIADTDGRFDWAVPDEEVHASINDRERAVGTYLFGRRMYAEMAEDPPRDHVSEMRDFAQVCARSTRSSTPAHALAAGLVDAGRAGWGQALLPDGVRLALELVEEHRFGRGVVHLGYPVGVCSSDAFLSLIGAWFAIPFTGREPRTGAVRRVTGGRPAS